MSALLVYLKTIFIPPIWSYSTHQKCTVLTPTGLFQRRWKVLCCSAAPASELWKRKPWAPVRRKGPVALRNAKRELLTKRNPTRDDIVTVGYGGLRGEEEGRRAGRPVIGASEFSAGEYQRTMYVHHEGVIRSSSGLGVKTKYLKPD